MKLFKLVLIASFILVPSIALAWGPLTHIYLGNELFSLGALLPAGLVEIIRRYRKDFLYGTLMADIIIGKKYMPETKSSHNWDVAFDLLSSARSDQQKAFVYGYMSHLAADTVAHNMYIIDRKNVGHTFMEMKADSIIDKRYWFQAIAIDKKIQIRNDLFLESSLERFIFSFKTNKRIFKSLIFFSGMNQQRIGDFIDKRLVTTMPVKEEIEQLHEESLDRIIDLFQNWESAAVVKVNPSGTVYKGKLIKAFLQS
jgi:hypothetical protein